MRKSLIRSGLWVRKREAWRWRACPRSIVHSKNLFGVILSAFSPNPRELETLQDLVTQPDVGEGRDGIKG